MKTVPVFAVALFFSAAAAAGDFRFDYSPAQLGTPEGMEKLHNRLESAANRYCRGQFIGLNVRGVEQCSNEIMKETVERIGNARLAAYQEARSQRSS